MIRPQVSLSIDAHQASVRVAENGGKYKYEIEQTRTKLADLASADDAQHTIHIKAIETSISAYQY